MRRITSIGRGLVVAMEDEELANTPAPEAELGAAADSLETDLVEVTEESAAADQQEESVAEAGETAEALESICVALESAAANGGLDKGAARVVGIAVDHMYKRVGIVGVKSMPALESFGGSSSRVGATQIAMEDIKEKVAAIWKAICDAIKKAADWVMGYFNKVFGAAEKLQKRAQSVAKAAEGTTGSVEKATFESDATVKALFIDDKVPSAFGAAVDKVAALMTEQLDTKAAATIAVGDKIVAAIEDPVGKAADISLPAVTASAGADAAYGEAGEGLAWFRSEQMLGGMAFAQRGAAAAKSGKEAIELFGKLKSGMMAFDPKKKAPTSANVPTLKASDVEKIAKSVEKIGSEIQTFRKTNSKLQELLKRASKAADKVSSSIDSAEEDKKEAMKAVRSAASNISNYVIGGYKSVSEYGLKVGKATLDYCEKSLKQYKAA